MEQGCAVVASGKRVLPRPGSAGHRHQPWGAGEGDEQPLGFGTAGWDAAGLAKTLRAEVIRHIAVKDTAYLLLIISPNERMF